MTEEARRVKDHSTQPRWRSCKSLLSGARSETQEAARDRRDVVSLGAYRQAACVPSSSSYSSSSWIWPRSGSALVPFALGNLATKVMLPAGHKSHPAQFLSRVVALSHYCHVALRKNVRHFPQPGTSREATRTRAQVRVAFSRRGAVGLLTKNSLVILVAGAEQVLNDVGNIDEAP